MFSPADIDVSALLRYDADAGNIMLQRDDKNYSPLPCIPIIHRFCGVARLTRITAADGSVCRAASIAMASSPRAIFIYDGAHCSQRDMIRSDTERAISLY